MYNVRMTSVRYFGCVAQLVHIVITFGKVYTWVLFTGVGCTLSARLFLCSILHTPFRRTTG